MNIKTSLRTSLLCAALFGSVGVAQANESADYSVYTKLGVPGVAVGAAYGLTEQFSLRADFSTIGSINRDFSRRSIDYTAKLKSNISTFSLDYFPFSNGWRLSAGLAAVQAKLTAEGKSKQTGTITIGGTTYGYGPEDRVNAQVKFPDTMAYLGLGYGHNVKGQQKGFGFIADLGAYFGRTETTLTVNDSLYQKMVTVAGQDVADQNIARERNSLANKADKLKVLPVVFVGLSYYF